MTPEEIHEINVIYSVYTALHDAEQRAPSHVGYAIREILKLWPSYDMIKKARATVYEEIETMNNEALEKLLDIIGTGSLHFKITFVLDSRQGFSDFNF